MFFVPGLAVNVFWKTHSRKDTRNAKHPGLRLPEGGVPQLFLPIPEPTGKYSNSRLDRRPKQEHTL